MSEVADPILTQFGVPPSCGSVTLPLEVDRSTGLLHESSVRVPFIEQMIDMGEKWRNLSAGATVLTESTDPIDPDLMRADSAWLRFGQTVGTGITKSDSDPMDPDIVHAAWLRWPFESAATLITRDRSDEPDPDLLRLEIVHDQRLNAG